MCSQKAEWLECDKVHRININNFHIYYGKKMCNLCYKLSRQTVREFMLCLEDVSSFHRSIEA